MIKGFSKWGVYWASVSILLIFLGFIFSASLGQTPYRYLGAITMSIGAVSIVVYFVLAAMFILFFGEKNLWKNVLTVYFIISISLIFGGLISSFLMYKQGLTIFIVGIASMMVFWLGVLVKMIFKKE